MIRFDFILTAALTISGFFEGVPLQIQNFKRISNESPEKFERNILAFEENLTIWHRFSIEPTYRIHL